MSQKRNINNLDLYTMPMDELTKHLKPWELGVLLQLEPLRNHTDILLDNMMDYYLEIELYEYCAIIRNEINSRKIA
jgi:hypothetical protein